MRFRRTAAALTSAAALSLTGVAMAPAASAQPLVTGGLVNVVVDVDNVLNNNEVLTRNNIAVGAALNLAAQLCNTSVNVLATQLGNQQQATCDVTQTQTLRIVQAQ